VTIVENPPAETVQPGACECQEAGRQGGKEMKGEGTLASKARISADPEPVVGETESQTKPGDPFAK
jgi:hypothetical protein